MAAVLGKICKPGLLRPTKANFSNQVNLIWTMSPKEKIKVAVHGIVMSFMTVGGYGIAKWLVSDVEASEQLEHPSYPFDFKRPFTTFDHASARRGYEVYKQICSACHSMKYVKYRELVNVLHTEEEAKAEAEAVQVQDGPNDIGEMFMRPGKLSDSFPSPYPNEQAARHANNGSYPPDLTLIILARRGGEDYIFSLLTGYVDAPAGINLREGQYYNPYFPGGAIAMAKALYNEAMEYEDGTPATASQMAKDVVEFLKWAGEPEIDERKVLIVKGLLFFPILVATIWYLKRHTWSNVINRKVFRTPPSPRLK